MEKTGWLSTQKEPNIDQLVPKVERVMQAYQNLQEPAHEGLRDAGAVLREGRGER